VAQETSGLTTHHVTYDAVLMQKTISYVRQSNIALQTYCTSNIQMLEAKIQENSYFNLNDLCI